MILPLSTYSSDLLYFSGTLQAPTHRNVMLEQQLIQNQRHRQIQFDLYQAEEEHVKI